jgi:hypothetical protein
MVYISLNDPDAALCLNLDPACWSAKCQHILITHPSSAIDQIDYLIR